MDRRPLRLHTRLFCTFAGTLPSVAIIIIGTRGFAKVGVGWTNAELWIWVLGFIGIAFWLAAIIIPALAREKGHTGYVTTSAAYLTSAVGVNFSIFASLQTP